MRIGRLRITRFKSIRDLDLTCRKVNVFIGPPDTGKTNILDALNFLSRMGWGWPIDSSLRLAQEPGFEALFFRQFFDKPIEIVTDDTAVRIGLKGSDRRIHVDLLGDQRVVQSWDLAWGESLSAPQLQDIRLYSFNGAEQWQYNTGVPLGDSAIATPHGGNLMYIARHNQEVYDFLKELVSGLDWKLRFDQVAKRFRLSEVRQDDIIDYNLELLSDSIKRFFFFGAILLTSKNAVLVFDEPDVQAFPPYPKELGRMIAEDETNQFFVSTHNPYILAELAEKTPRDDLGLFVCRRDPDHGTGARMLEADEVEQVIDWGASTFFNLSKFDR